MYINPQVAIDEGWIKGIADVEKQVQPNAIDFTLDHLYTIAEAPFFLAEDHKIMRGGVKVSTVPADVNEVIYDTFQLAQRTVYDGMSDIYVDLPEGVAAELIIRSTLNRNGIFLTSGLYDSGFQGNIGFAIHNQSNCYASLQKGVRVGQIKFVKTDPGGLYAGGWNHKEGTHWAATKQSIPNFD